MVEGLCRYSEHVRKKVRAGVGREIASRANNVDSRTSIGDAFTADLCWCASIRF
jgi:hypothetical protein